MDTMQSYVLAKQAADPEWQAWNAYVSSLPFDAAATMAPPTRDYATEYIQVQASMKAAKAAADAAAARQAAAAQQAAAQEAAAQAAAQQAAAQTAAQQAAAQAALQQAAAAQAAAAAAVQAAAAAPKQPMTYAQHNAAMQKFVLEKQAADPEWVAWKQAVAALPFDVPGPASPDTDYAAAYLDTLTPEERANYFTAYAADLDARKRTFKGRIGQLMQAVPIAVATAGVLTAAGVIGAGAQAAAAAESVLNSVGAAAGAGVAEASAASAAAAAAEAAASVGAAAGAGVAEATAASAAGGIFSSQAAIDAALAGAAQAAGSVGAAAGAGVAEATAASAAAAAAEAAGSVGAAAGAGVAEAAAASAATTASQVAGSVGAAAGAGVPAATPGLLSQLGGVGQVVSTGLGVAGAIAGAAAAKDQAEEAQATARYNALEAEFAAQNALLRGEEQARDLRRQGSLVEGAQRATFASRGVDLNVGTPKQAIEQADFFTRQDMATARSNAATEAATYRRQGSRYQAQSSNIKPGATAGLSLVSNLATVASKWYTNNSPFKP